MEARALTRHEKASLKSFLSGVYAGVILSLFSSVGRWFLVSLVVALFP